MCDGVVDQGLLTVKCLQMDPDSGMMARQEGIEGVMEGLEGVSRSRVQIQGMGRYSSPQ